MENKSANSENKSEKKVKERRKFTSREKLFIGIIIAVLVICIIVAVVVINNANKTKAELDGNANNPAQTETNNNVGLIDMSKTENVEIKQGVKENNSEALKKEKTFEGMVIKDIKLSASSGLTNFTATVENKTGKDVKGRKIIIIFKNEDGSEYARLNGVLTDVKNNGTTVIDASTTADLANAYDFVIENK